MTNFERFYITWYSRAIHFAREYVLSENDAENIVQDVFLHLYEPATGWMYTPTLQLTCLLPSKTNVWTTYANG